MEKNIANKDPKTIHDKIEKYDQLDSEQRYIRENLDDKLSEISPSSWNNSLRKAYLSSSLCSIKLYSSPHHSDQRQGRHSSLASGKDA